jgi:predicted nucleic acid-binding protein
MKFFLADTGYLLALYGPGDDYRNVERARRSFRMFEQTQNALLLAWPVLYETLNTRLARRVDAVERIEVEWRKLRASNQLFFVDDQPFRQAALSDWESRTPRYRSLSLVDQVLRNAILSVSLRIDALLTFNVRDFADVCSKRGVEILPV